MDSHQPADPWEIPAAPVDEAEPAESSEPGSVLVDDDVSAAPQNPAPTAADHAPEPPVPLPEEPTDEFPADEFPAPMSEEPTDEFPVEEFPVEEAPAPEAPAGVAEVPDPGPETVEVAVSETSADPAVVESTPESSTDATPEPDPTPAPPRFDLGLDEEPAEPWGGEGQTFESGTAFDLVRPIPTRIPSRSTRCRNRT